MTKTIELRGVDEMVKNLRAQAARYPEAAAGALYEEGLGVDADMVPRIPVDTGRVRSTHYVAPPKREGDEVYVEVGVGTDYAVPLHERTEVPHAVGEAKFLEHALYTRSSGMLGRLAARTAANAEAGHGVTPTPDVPRRPATVGRRKRPRRSPKR